MVFIELGYHVIWNYLICDTWSGDSVTSFDTPLTWWFMYFVAFTEPFWLHLSFLFDLTFDVISRTYVTTWCLCGIFLEQIWRHCTRDDVITWSRLHLNAHMIVRWPADDVIIFWHNLILSIENYFQKIS